jgi:hypothetical protein
LKPQKFEVIISVYKTYAQHPHLSTAFKECVSDVLFQCCGFIKISSFNVIQICCGCAVFRTKVKFARSYICHLLALCQFHSHYASLVSPYDYLMNFIPHMLYSEIWNSILVCVPIMLKDLFVCFLINVLWKHDEIRSPKSLSYVCTETYIRVGDV